MYSRAVRWGKESVGTAFVAIRGGRHRRGLIVIGLVLFILIGCGSSWYIIILVRVLGRARSLSCAFFVMRTHCRAHLVSFAYVIVRARSLLLLFIVVHIWCHLRALSFACIVVHICIQL